MVFAPPSSTERSQRDIDGIEPRISDSEIKTQEIEITAFAVNKRSYCAG